MKLKAVLFTFALFLLVVVLFLSTGFFLVGEGEVAVVAVYRPIELVPRYSPELPFMGFGSGDLLNVLEPEIYGPHPLGKLYMVTIENESVPLLSRLTELLIGKRLYWHLPPPFAEHHVYKLENVEFTAEAPLIMQLANERRMLFLVFTRNGTKLVTPMELKPRAFKPGAKRDGFKMLFIRVKGWYDVEKVRRYLIFCKMSGWQVNKIVENQLSMLLAGTRIPGTALIANNTFQLLRENEVFKKLVEEKGLRTAWNELLLNESHHVWLDIYKEVTDNPAILIKGLRDLANKLVEEKFGIKIKEKFVVEVYEEWSYKVVFRFRS